MGYIGTAYEFATNFTIGNKTSETQIDLGATTIYVYNGTDASFHTLQVWVFSYIE